MDIALGFWIADPENGQGGVKSEVHLAVLDVLRAEGIDIPFPQRVLHTMPAAMPPSTPAEPGTPGPAATG
jgi:small-conductance mechanosensitive channel